VRYLILLLVVVSTNVFAASAVIRGKVVSTLSDGNLYGGCMAAVIPAKTLSEYGLSCRNAYFSFDCRADAGMPGGRAQAELNFQQAQLAMALDADVQLTVIDTVTLNGNCYAQRVVVLKPE
jgi:hypothetical protein